MTERPLRWPGWPLNKSVRSPATKFITPVRSLWPLAEWDKLTDEWEKRGVKEQPECAILTTNSALSHA